MNMILIINFNLTYITPIILLENPKDVQSGNFK